MTEDKPCIECYHRMTDICQVCLDMNPEYPFEVRDESHPMWEEIDE